MNRKSFSIPVGWEGRFGYIPHDGIRIYLNSSTLVLPVPGRLLAGFEVERIPGSWSPHIPEKKPRYRVSWDSYSTNPIEVEPVRLGSIGRTPFLVPLIAKRPQTCIRDKGLLHGIYVVQDDSLPYTNCGERIWITLHDRQDPERLAQRFVADTEPTCKACLLHKAVWCMFQVFPYEAKQDEAKRVKKERTEAEKRLTLPTAYARVLDDDLFENPSYKPVKRRIAPTPLDVDETDEFDAGPRDRKRASAMDRTRRIDDAKARVQGHRR